jgi:hypothetical protein
MSTKKELENRLKELYEEWDQKDDYHSQQKIKKEIEEVKKKIEKLGGDKPPKLGKKFLPKKSLQQKRNLAFRLEAEVFAEVEKKLERKNLSWHDLFRAACAKFLEDGEF